MFGIGEMNEKADAATKAGLLRRVTTISNPYGAFKKHINVLLKRKWQSQQDEAVNNKVHDIHPGSVARRF